MCVCCRLNLSLESASLNTKSFRKVVDQTAFMIIITDSSVRGTCLEIGEWDLLAVHDLVDFGFLDLCFSTSVQGSCSDIILRRPFSRTPHNVNQTRRVFTFQDVVQTGCINGPVYSCLCQPRPFAGWKIRVR